MKPPRLPPPRLKPLRLKSLRLLAFATLVAAPATAEELDITVTGIRSNQGRIVVAICDKANFPSGACPYHAQAPARIGEVTVPVGGVPPGTWAAAVYHDETGNQPLQFSMFGIPKQGIGFSRDAKMRFGPPSFADAAFTSGGASVPLHYPG